MRDAKNSEMKKMLAGTIALLVVVASVGVYQKWFSKTSKFDEDHIGECYYQEIQEEHVATDDLTMYTDNEILLVTEDSVKKRAVEKLAKKYDAASQAMKLHLEKAKEASFSNFINSY